MHDKLPPGNNKFEAYGKKQFPPKKESAYCKECGMGGGKHKEECKSK